jgi:hypothetical protein
MRETRKKVPSDHSTHQIAIKYTIWSKNKHNGHKKYQNLPLQDLPKFTKIGIFVRKYATRLVGGTVWGMPIVFFIQE